MRKGFRIRLGCKRTTNCVSACSDRVGRAEQFLRYQKAKRQLTHVQSLRFGEVAASKHFFKVHRKRETIQYRADLNSDWQAAFVG
jgi:hypothetical protein